MIKKQFGVEEYSDIIAEIRNIMKEYNVGFEDLFPEIADRVQFLEWQLKSHKLPSANTKRPE